VAKERSVGGLYAFYRRHSSGSRGTAMKKDPEVFLGGYLRHWKRVLGTQAKLLGTSGGFKGGLPIFWEFKNRMVPKREGGRKLSSLS